VNAFEQTYGTDLLRKPLPIAVIFSAVLISAHLIAAKGLWVAIALVVFPVGLFYISALLLRPRIGIITILIFGFFVVGLSRYLPATWGLAVDGLLILMYLALFFKEFRIRVPWSNAYSQLTLLAGIWFVYIFMQVANPEAASVSAWFYAMRGIGLYQFLLIPLVFILFNRPKDLMIFLYIWAALSALGTLKGAMQLWIGVDPFEQAWLDRGGHITHVLFGKLRIFSFYSDAGQFGASQGHAGVVFGVLAVYSKTMKGRIFWGTMALLGLYGMMISGTRGAIAVPGAGGIMLLILRRNIPFLILGGLMAIGTYIFFAHTTLLQNQPQVRRMRTAFDPNDPSLLVRKENQRRLKSYLASRPIGGGVGASGNWGQRFTPTTFLANTATDSWFVAIWADTGVVGLYLHLLVLFTILITGMQNVMFKIKDFWLRGQVTAIVCGMAGIMAASYGNGVFGQFPTGVLMYIGMAFIYLSPKMDRYLRGERNIEHYVFFDR